MRVSSGVVGGELRFAVKLGAFPLRGYRRVEGERSRFARYPTRIGAWAELRALLETWLVGVVVGGGFGGVDGDGVGEAEADDAFRRYDDLLAAGGALDGCASAGACGRADGCAFAAAEDAAEDGAYGSAAADFLGSVFAAAFAFDGVGIGGEGDIVAVAAERGELDGEQGTAFEMGGVVGR